MRGKTACTILARTPRLPTYTWGRLEESNHRPTYPRERGANKKAPVPFMPIGRLPTHAWGIQNENLHRWAADPRLPTRAWSILQQAARRQAPLTHARMGKAKIGSKPSASPSRVPTCAWDKCLHDISKNATLTHVHMGPARGVEPPTHLPTRAWGKCLHDITESATPTHAHVGHTPSWSAEWRESLAYPRSRGAYTNI